MNSVYLAKKIRILKKVLKYFLVSLNIILAIALLATYLVPKVNPAKFWIPSVLGLAYSYILLLNALFILFWLVVSWRFLFISLLTILAGYQINNSYIQFFEKKTENNNGIKILSYNVQHFYSYLDKKNPNTGILDFIAGQNANIICLQDTKLQKEGNLNPIKMKSLFPGIKHCQLAHQSKWGGQVTFSSYPIVSMGELRFEDSKNMVIFTNLKIGNDTIRVYNCHLQSFGINPSQYSIIDTLGFDTKKLKEMKTIGGKLKRANISRSKQVLILTDHIAKCPYPVIVCGDFNDTPVSFTYGKIRSLLNDSFVSSGKGVSNTYRGKLPQNRIDYIFYSNHFKAYNYHRHNMEYSDHYPISTTLIKKD
jgi:endonuclease/exonuclease/phosphatase family metal-dependent hydrolase